MVLMKSIIICSLKNSNLVRKVTMQGIYKIIFQNILHLQEWKRRETKQLRKQMRTNKLIALIFFSRNLIILHFQAILETKTS